MHAAGERGSWGRPGLHSYVAQSDVSLLPTGSEWSNSDLLAIYKDDRQASDAMPSAPLYMPKLARNPELVDPGSGVERHRKSDNKTERGHVNEDRSASRGVSVLDISSGSNVSKVGWLLLTQQTPDSSRRYRR